MKKILFYCLLICFAVGCAGPSTVRKASKEKELLEDTQNFIILNTKGMGKLSSKISIAGQKVERLYDNRIKIQSKIYNKTKKDIKIQVQTIFKDNAGYPTGDETNFELIIIPAAAYYYYSVESMNDKAENYVIRAKWAN